jgi:hypothetical protein
MQGSLLKVCISAVLYRYIIKIPSLIPYSDLHMKRKCHYPVPVKRLWQEYAEWRKNKSTNLRQ